MDIETVENVLSRHVMIKPPKHVVIIDDYVLDEFSERMYYVNGATPSWLHDVIVLSKTATEETVVHELLHTYGFGEDAAYSISPILYNLRRSFALRRRNVKYYQCNGCNRFRVLHERYSDVAKHYVLQGHFQFL